MLNDIISKNDYIGSEVMAEIYQDFAKDVQNHLLKMGYITREISEKSGNITDDDDVDLSETLDEEEKVEVVSYLHGWYGKSIHFMQPLLDNTNFTFQVPWTVSSTKYGDVLYMNNLTTITLKW